MVTTKTTPKVVGMHTDRLVRTPLEQKEDLEDYLASLTEMYRAKVNEMECLELAKEAIGAEIVKTLKDLNKANFRDGEWLFSRRRKTEKELDEQKLAAEIDAMKIREQVTVREISTPLLTKTYLEKMGVWEHVTVPIVKKDLAMKLIGDATLKEKGIYKETISYGLQVKSPKE